MTCENPKFATAEEFFKLDETTGEIYKTKKLHFVNEFNEETPLKEKVYTIPCGKCRGCRISKAKDWAIRAVAELKAHKKAAFLTLTYNNENLPKKRSLQKKDLQNFWKRLRKSNEKIRYLACGEYGPRTKRPHYHAIVFGYWPEDAKFYNTNITNDDLFTSKKLNSIWQKGYVIVGRVTYKSAAYVARYVYKKAFGTDINTKKGQEKEFVLTSRKPGLGDYVLHGEEFEKLKRNFGILIKTETGVKNGGLPQFFRRKWREKYDREEYFKIAEEFAHTYKTITRARLKKGKNNWFQDNKNKIEIQTQKLKRLDKRQDL